ncbi:ATP-dependent DNA ligase [Radiomyces spectabilis]|uniref:ATP-dependent DNA ligase n=1 Tax=Radiomyces spectabilis TaxID=64574 RepID=UPI0022203CE4|nr:ATP-dependent DNA ligase [Radiomyces spectabilis]KAI8376118.1 ATP-dependent DNA ligase [Radiomyces spectabilis]
MVFDPQQFPGTGQWHGRAPYSFLASVFSMVSSISARTVMLNIMCNMLRVIIVHSPQDILPAIWLCSNAIAPSFEGLELGIGPQILSKALRGVSSVNQTKLRKLYERYGDWGDVAFAAKASVRTIVKPKPLTVREVFQTLHAIAGVKGKGGVDTKAGLVRRLLLSAVGEEVRFIVRTLVAHLRIGAVRTTVLIALARACVFMQSDVGQWPISGDLVRQVDDSKDVLATKLKQAENGLKECFAQCPDWNLIVPWLMECKDVSRVFERCGITVGVPLRPMLGQITRDLTDMFIKLKDRDFACEYKYDGQRAQIHMDNQGRVKLFSRHLEDMTDKYPDIVEVLPRIRSEGTTSFIMDGEIVAMNSEGEIQPFQTLSNRARKNVTLDTIVVPVCVLAFDLMYLNNESLLQLSFRERRTLLKERFVRVKHRFDFVKSMDATGITTDQDKVQAFFKASIGSGGEGIMVKLLDHPPKSLEPSARAKGLLSTYEPDKRVESWLKVKKDYVEGVGDSLDLVPIGAWYGSGRKAGWYSPILLACYNPENETLESVCKCMSGFSDKFYKEMKDYYSEENLRVLNTPRHDYVTDLQPNVWFDACQVWEIKGADITVSPVHKGAIGRIEEDRGLSLRFPRFIRVRDDKPTEEATTSELLATLYLQQQVREVAEEENEEEQEEQDD